MLTNTEIRTFAALKEPLAVKTISAQLGLSVPASSRITARMAEKGFAERKRTGKSV